MCSVVSSPMQKAPRAANVAYSIRRSPSVVGCCCSCCGIHPAIATTAVHSRGSSVCGTQTPVRTNELIRADTSRRDTLGRRFTGGNSAFESSNRRSNVRCRLSIEARCIPVSYVFLLKIFTHHAVVDRKK